MTANNTGKPNVIITLDDIRAMTNEQLLVMFPAIPQLFTYHPELDQKKEKAK